MRSILFVFLSYFSTSFAQAPVDLNICRDHNFKTALASRTVCFSGYSPSECHFSDSITPYLEAGIVGFGVAGGAAVKSHVLVKPELKRIGEKLSILNAKTQEYLKITTEFEDSYSVRKDKKIADRMFKVLEERGKLVSQLDAELIKLGDYKLAAMIDAERKAATTSFQAAMVSASQNKNITVEERSKLTVELERLNSENLKANQNKTELMKFAQKKLQIKHASVAVSRGATIGAGALATGAVIDFAFTKIEKQLLSNCGYNIDSESYEIIHKYAELNRSTCKLFIPPESIAEIVKQDESTKILNKAPILCSIMQEQLKDLKKRQDEIDVKVRVTKCDPKLGQYSAEVTINNRTFNHTYKKDSYGNLILESSIFPMSEKEKVNTKNTDHSRNNFSVYMSSDEEWSSVQSNHLSFGNIGKLSPYPGKMTTYYQYNGKCELPKIGDGLASSSGQLVCGIGQEIVAANHSYNTIMNCEKFGLGNSDSNSSTTQKETGGAGAR